MFDLHLSTSPTNGISEQQKLQFLELMKDVGALLYDALLVSASARHTNPTCTRHFVILYQIDCLVSRRVIEASEGSCGCGF